MSMFGRERADYERQLHDRLRAQRDARARYNAVAYRVGLPMSQPPLVEVLTRGLTDAYDIEADALELLEAAQFSF